MKHLNEDERMRRNAEFLSRLVVQHSAIPGVSTQSNQCDDAVRLLVKHGLEPLTWLTQSYLDLGLHPAHGARAKEALIAEGKVLEQRMLRRGSGGHPCLLELLPPGIEVVRRMGFSPVLPDGKGKFRHWAYAEGYIARWANRMNYRHWRERTLGGKQIDVVVEDSEHRLIAFEICLSGSYELNASAGVRCAALEGIFRVVLACESKNMMNGIKKILSQEMTNVRSKISVESLAEYYPEDA